MTGAAAQQLALKAIQGARAAVPGWGALRNELLKCEVITGGLTNKLNLVYLDEGAAGAAGESKALIRIFGTGTDQFINRDAEAAVSAAMSAVGIGPRVFGAFPGGRAEEFIDRAVSIKCGDLHRPHVLAEVARLMAAMHSVDVSAYPVLAQPADPRPRSSSMMWGLWQQACRTTFEVDAKKALKLAAMQVGTLAREIEWIEKEMERSGMGTVLCHRDLQSGNVLVQRGPRAAGGATAPPGAGAGEARPASPLASPKPVPPPAKELSNDEFEKVFLIDFEYSGVDYCAFDFGNTFCEMSINNFCSRFPGFVIDPDMYPDRNKQRAFFQEYLKHVREPRRLFAQDRQPADTAAMVERLCKFSDLGALASHMQWALWGIVQAEHSTIDWGYLEYTTARMDQFWALRRAYKFHNSS